MWRRFFTRCEQVVFLYIQQISIKKQEENIFRTFKRKTKNEKRKTKNEKRKTKNEKRKTKNEKRKLKIIFI
ncbi:hypothetical protein ORM92_10245 [Bacillus cereus]|uniref:hypothetical protein n=1 Tax=Bacillus cereus TaxID=1396 RepID=UPI002ABF4850|nr:hypothetical protein [Bacillus cereus]MDZ4531513.1 hypothetical protein [Bacillus cereus]